MAKTIKGIVVSNSGSKTIVIKAQTRKTHRIYKKKYSFSNKVMAHDEKNEAQIGDTVLIGETRPLSRRKRFELIKILIKPAIRESESVDAVTEDQAEVEKPIKETKAKPAAVKKPKTEPKK